MTSTFTARAAFISLWFLALQVGAQGPEKIQEEKELEVVDFKSIKKVLQQDGLSEEAQKKKEVVAVLKKELKVVDTKRFSYPSAEELWKFTSEYWLVKNAQLLRWDFKKPDYGLDKSFKLLLEKLGFYQKKFKILVIDSPNIVRTALPSEGGEVIYLLSLPFIRSLDMSKLEISLFLLEDYFRAENGYFRKAVATEKMSKLAGTNFYGGKPDMSLVEELLKNYDQQIYSKGYSFQQQFEVTKKMDSYLKSTPEYWNTYFKLLGRINLFLRGNQQYKDYTKLYPSPEMQLKWMSPEEKVL